MSSDQQIIERLAALERDNAHVRSVCARQSRQIRMQMGIAATALLTFLVFAPGGNPAIAQGGNGLPQRIAILEAQMTAEITARTQGDINTLASAKSYTDDKLAGFDTQITTEIARAQAAEAVLTTKVTALQTLTAPLSLTGSELKITGVNVHILNGTNDTNNSNSLGNLILGYNESRVGVNWALSNGPDARTGSHNLILGIHNNFTSSAGVITGAANNSKSLGSIMAGVLNNANNWGNVVFGVSNTAIGSYSTVLGGQGNVASGDTVVVLGGYFNLASGYVSCISGGGYNNAIGNGSSVSGGLGNTAGFMPDGDWSTVSGGRGVIEEAWSGWAAGGFNNTDIFTRPDRAQSGPGTFSFPLP